MSGTLSDLVNRQAVNGGIPITNLRVHGDLLRIVGALKLAIPEDHKNLTRWWSAVTRRPSARA